MKIKFWQWFSEKVIKIEDNVEIPKRWMWVAYLLFPLQYWAYNKRNPRYEPMYDAIVFDGYRYPAHVFRYLRNEDCFITVKEKGAVHSVDIKINILPE